MIAAATQFTVLNVEVRRRESNRWSCAAVIKRHLSVGFSIPGEDRQAVAVNSCTGYDVVTLHRIKLHLGHVRQNFRYLFTPSRLDSWTVCEMKQSRTQRLKIL